MAIKLIVANYLPEFKDGRVKRVDALAKYLCTSGIKTKIISFGACELHTDFDVKFRSLAIKYFRNQSSTNNPLIKKNRIFNLLKKLARRLVFPDIYILDTLLSLRKVKHHVEPGDLVIISVPWFSILLFCVSLRNNTIVVDFRDLYLANPIFSKYHTLDKIFFRFCMQFVSEIWVTTNAAKESIGTLVACPVRVVPNGVSDEEIALIKQHSAEREATLAEIKIGYFGNLGGNRDFRTLFKKLKMMPNIELVGAGNFDADHLDIFDDSYLGFLDKSSLYQHMANVDIVIVCIREEEHSDFAVPAKIFEVMCAGLPILLVSPLNAAAKSLLDEHDYPHLWMSPDSSFSYAQLQDLSSSVCHQVVYSRSKMYAHALSKLPPEIFR